MGRKGERVPRYSHIISDPHINPDIQKMYLFIKEYDFGEINNNFNFEFSKYISDNHINLHATQTNTNKNGLPDYPKELFYELLDEPEFIYRIDDNILFCPMNLVAFETLIKLGVNPKSINNDKRTILMAQIDNIEIVKYRKLSEKRSI